jgi:hypothetical protein
MIKKLLGMIPGEAWVIGVLFISASSLGWALLKQHDRRVAAEAVAEMLAVEADSLRKVADAAWNAKEASDSAHSAELDSLNAELEEAREVTDSLVIELPELQTDVDSLMNVLEEFAPPELQPVVVELRFAVDKERQTSAGIFRNQQRQIASLTATSATLTTQRDDALAGWADERRLRFTLEEQLAAVIDASKPDLLMDRVIPAALGAAAVLLVDKVVQ